MSEEMTQIQLIEETSNFKDLIKAGIVSIALPSQIDIYYHYIKTKSVSKTADEKNVSRKHVWHLVKEFERNLT
jgi:molybdenum-dependent DNA-binding transcriptional regulator ModE